MNFIKRFMVAALVLFIAAGTLFAGGKSDASKDGKVRIGISVMTHNNPFFLAEIEGFQEAAAKIWGSKVEIFTPDPALDVTKQIEQCQDLVNRGITALLIDAIDVDAIQPAVEAANAAKIPVIAIDTAIPNLKSNLLCEIYSDNVKAGKIAAQHLIDAMGGSGEIGILNHPEVACVRERTDGLKEVMKSFSGVKIVADVASHGNVIESQQVMETFIQAYPNMKGVFAINDPTAQGAIAAIKASGRNIKVVSVDGSQNAIDMVKAGELIVSAAQDPKAIGAKAAEVVDAYIKGTKVQDTYVIDTFPINTTNWQQYDGKQF
jgi:ABC-type sugar transport system substrate-binding protein